MSKVLVVDDDALIRFTVKKLLEARGHEVIVAAGGKEGIKAAAKHRPDLIILDICMPDMDGLAVLKTLKEQKATSGIPVIMLTGVDTRESIKEAMYWYTERYIVKPFEEAELHAAIERVLGSRK